MQRYTSVGRELLSVINFHRLSSGKAARKSAAPLVRWVCCVLALAAVTLASSPASAGVLTWDANGLGAGQTDGTGTWLNADQWWDPLANGGTGGNATWNNGNPDDALIGVSGVGGAITLGTVTAGSVTFNSFTGTYTLSGGGLTLNNGLTINAGAGAVTVNSPVTVGGSQVWANNSASTLTIVGAVTYTNGVTLNGGNIQLNNQTNTGTGGLTLSAGRLLVGTNNSVNLIAGAAGSVLTLSGGTVSTTSGGSGGNRVFGNDLLLNGSVQIGDGSSTGGNYTFQGTNQTFNGAILSARDNNGVLFITNPAVLTGNLTVNTPSAGVAAPFTFSGGLTVSGAASANRTVTGNNGAVGVTFSGPLEGTATGQTLILAGGGSNNIVGLLTAGANTPKLIVAGTMANLFNGGVFSFQNTGSTFNGGFEAQNGIVEIPTNGTMSSGSNSVLGAGTITFSGGTLRTGQSYDITFDKPFTIKGAGMTIIPNPSATRTLNFGASLMTVDGASTLTNFSSGITIGGLVTGVNSPSLAAKGTGTVTLTNVTGTASSFGNLAIGDSVASGSLAGNLQITGTTAAMRDALGSGTITVNYGGSLTLGNQNGDYIPTQAITVNNGGAMIFNVMTGYTYGSATLTVNSGGTLTVNNKAITFNTATNASFPTAGVFFNNSGKAYTITGAYPSLTGTLALGGTASVTQTYGSATTLSSVTDTARTLAFNNSGAGATVLPGLTLNANLTVAGTGNAGVSGAIQQGSSGSLGAVTQSGGARSITVAMAPTGQASMTATAAGFTGGLTITGGIFSVDGGNTVGVKAGGTIALNGGGIRNQNAANNNCTWQDAISIGANGGTIESFSVGNTQAVTFSGAITGSGPLTLRYGGSGTNNSSVLLAPGTTSSYNGPITLATTSAKGRVQFNDNSLAGQSAGNITVPGGVAFGFDALATLTVANLAKLTTSTDAVLVLDNLTGATGIDLSGSGLNKDIRIGWTSNPTYVGTLTPYGNTYNFTPQGDALNFKGLNALNGSNNVDVRAGAIAPGAYNVIAGGALNITNSNNYTGTTYVAGTINNSLIGGGTSTITLRVTNDSTTSQGNLTGTTGITVTRGAGMAVSGTVANTGRISSANVPITVMGGSTFTDGSTTAADNNGVTDRIVNTATLTLGGADGGGTFRIAAPVALNTHAQTLASLTVNAGSNTITAYPIPVSSANGTTSLTFTGTAGGAGYTRTAGGAVSVDTTIDPGNITTTNTSALITFAVAQPNIKVGSRIYVNAGGLNRTDVFVTEILSTTQVRLSRAANASATATSQDYYTSFDSALTNFNAKYTNAPTSLGGSTVVGGLLVGTFLNNTDFAVAGAGTNLTAPAYTEQSAVASWGANQDITNAPNTAFSGTVAGGGLTINSLRSYMGGTVTIGTTDTLTVASGMILHASGSPTLTFTGGSLTSGNGADLIFNTHNSSPLTVNSKITGGLALTKVGGGTLTLNNAGNAIGDVYVLGGTIQTTTATDLPTGGTHSFNLLGGTLNPTATTTFGNGISLNVGPQGGTFSPNNGQTVTVNGPVTINGNLAWNVGSGGSGTSIIFNGNVNGPGLIGFGKGPNGKNPLVFTGDNSAWSGGIRQDTAFGNAAGGATHIRFSPTTAGYNSAGTGPIVYANGPTPGGLYFDTTFAGSTTFSNDIINNVGNAPIVAWGLSTGLSASGTVNTSTLSGKIVGNQGLVLQGYATGDSAISELVLSGTVSMSGTSAGYSYGTSTAVQNFVNGQGGATLGVTTLQGTAAVNTQYTDPRIDLPGSTIASNGAEGFVRFSGAQSFIPGAVGPGYISAIRKAGTAQDGRFGYLLTATTPTPTTYLLPEGKSFLIGSLGAGTQQYGTLGAVGGGTAILVGGNKYAPGQLLAGFGGGDVNVHANAATDNQKLNLFARAAGDTFQIGTALAPVVFTPTYGDSGFTSAITLMAKRTGSTTLNKVGAGTVEVKNAAFTHVDGSDARGAFTWNINAGTLLWSQDDSAAAALGGVSVSAGGNLAVGGKLKSALVLNGGTLTSGGLSTGTLLGTTSVLADSSVVDGGAGALTAGDISTSAAVTLTVAANADLQAQNVSGAGSTSVSSSLTADSIVQNTLSIGAGATVTIRETTGGGVSTVPEPGTSVLIGTALLAWLVFRRRR
jgi:fibronectin-binding autotransporter adhesin